MKGFFKRINPCDELEQEVRKLYQGYVLDFFLSPTIISNYEKRLEFAKRSGSDLPGFLAAEKEAVEILRAKRVKKIAGTWNRGPREEPVSVSDSVEKLMEKHRQMIAVYPKRALHPEASDEMTRLAGAIELWESNHWWQFRDELIACGLSSIVKDVESGLNLLVDHRSDVVPSAFRSYVRSIGTKASERTAQGVLAEIARLICRAQESGLQSDHLDSLKTIGDNFRLTQLIASIT